MVRRIFPHDRELRIVELKERIRELEGQAKGPPGGDKKMRRKRAELRHAVLESSVVSRATTHQLAVIVFLTLLLLATLVPTGGEAFGGTVQLTPRERQWLAEHDGRIRIGITVIPPQILRDNGELTGLSVDYIRLMERKLGCRFTLVPYATWNEVIRAAKDRRIDMIFAAQRTPERLAYLLFTEPYLELPNMIVVRRDRQGGRELKEMTGWRVVTSAGSAVHEYLKEGFPNLNLVPVQDELSGLMKVSLGEVDAMVVEISRASYYIEKAGILNLRIAGSAGLLYQLRFAVRSDWPTLAGILDKGLTAITSEERRDIGRRWIIVGDKSVFASRGFRIGLTAGAGGIALAIAAVVVWNRALRRTVRERTSELHQELAERKEAEEALGRERALLRCIIDSAGDLIFVKDRDGVYIGCNRASEAFVGLPESEQIGKTDYDFFDREMAEKVRRDDLRVIEGGEMLRTEEWVTYPDGHRVLLDTLKVPFYGPDGAVNGLVGISRDITERKRAEENIRRLNEELEQRVAERAAELRTEMESRFSQQQFLEAVLESTEAGIVACDADGILTLFNRKSRELHGLPQKPIPADQWAGYYDLFLPDGKTPMRKEEVPLFRALKGERVSNVEMMIIPRGEEPKILLASGQSLLDREGRKIGAVVAMHDITGRKRAEEMLRASEEKYRSVVENIGIGVTMISPDMEILALNTCMKSWFPKIDVSRRPICYESFIDPPRDGLCLNCPTYRTLQDGEVHEAIIETLAGESTMYFRVLSSPIRDKDGNVIAATELVENVTEKQATETELRQYREHLEELIRERTAELENSNVLLQSELTERKRAEESLHELTDKLEQRVRERTAELEVKNADLEKMNRVFVGRELKMAELKARIRELEERLPNNIEKAG